MKVITNMSEIYGKRINHLIKLNKWRQMTRKLIENVTKFNTFDLCLSFEMYFPLQVQAK